MAMRSDILDTITVIRSHYEQLALDAMILRALYTHGVEDWPRFTIARTAALAEFYHTEVPILPGLKEASMEQYIEMLDTQAMQDATIVMCHSCGAWFPMVDTEEDSGGDVLCRECRSARVVTWSNSSCHQ